MNIELNNQRALVTGANSGIGREVALALGRNGARVAVNYLTRPEEAEQVVADIKKSGVDAMAIQADVSDSAAVSRMFEKIDKTWGGIDLLVNNAGIDGKRAMSWEIDPGDFAKVIEVNLLGAFHCAHEALRRMIKAGAGVVLNLTSVHEEIPWSGYAAYTASKAGLSMLTKTLSQEAAPHGVRLLALAPGAVKTPINENVWSNPSSYKDLLTKIPLGRMAEASEIGEMVVLLMSRAAGYITGTTVFVDGGMTDFPSFEHGG
ncbi:MAG TPA: 3-oxoacyl-ACP reductase FabG [Thermoanaerobaculia bacterium]|nr:3-oxoacyl-ACP reductase FabG [Thermoanaerobaculia bacterium]